MQLTLSLQWKLIWMLSILNPDHHMIVRFKNWTNLVNLMMQEKSLEQVVMNYFTDLHDNKELMASTLSSKFSIINTILQISDNFRLENQVPQLSRVLKNWAKHQICKIHPQALFLCHAQLHHLQLPYKYSCKCWHGFIKSINRQYFYTSVDTNALQTW